MVHLYYGGGWWVVGGRGGGRGILVCTLFSEHLAGHLGDEVHGHHGEDETGGQEQHYERVHTQSVGLVGENLQDAAAGAPEPRSTRRGRRLRLLLLLHGLRLSPSLQRTVTSRWWWSRHFL